MEAYNQVTYIHGAVGTIEDTIRDRLPPPYRSAYCGESSEALQYNA